MSACKPASPARAIKCPGSKNLLAKRFTTTPTCRSRISTKLETMTRNVSVSRYQYQANPNQLRPNMKFVVIVHLRYGHAATRFITVPGHDAFHWGDRGVPHTRGLEDRPSRCRRG